MTFAGLRFATASLLLLFFVIAPSIGVRIRIGSIIDSYDLADSFKLNDSAGLLFEYDKFETFLARTAGDFDILHAICRVMSEKPFAFFSVLNASTIPVTSDFMNAFNMPLITISNPTGYSTQLYNDSQPLLQQQQQQQHNDFILYMKPAYDRALVDVVLDYKWTKIYYIYDGLEGFHRQLKLLEASADSALEFKSVKLSDADNAYETLRFVDSLGTGQSDKYIVLDLSSDRALVSVLKQIQSVGMNKKGYHYLLGGIAFDEIDFADLMHGGMRVTGFSLLTDDVFTYLRDVDGRLTLQPVGLPKPGSRQKVDALLSMDSAAILSKAFSGILEENKNEFSDVELEGRPTSCRSNQTWKKGDLIMKHLRKTHFQGASGVVSFDDRGLRRSYSLGIYELGLNSDLRNVGVWTDGKGLTKTGGGSEELPVKLEKKKIIITSILTSPFLMLKPSAGNATGRSGIDSYEGYCVDLITELSRRLNLDVTLRPAADGKYGSVNRGDGSYNGMIGELITKQADIAVAPLTITSMRERVVDFSKPFMTVGISVMIKKPQKQKPGLFHFLDRFEFKIWMFLFLSYLATGFVLFLIGRFSSYSWQVKEVKECKVDGLTTKVGVPNLKNEFTLLNSLWFVLGGFMRQGCCVSPRCLSGRVVSFTWHVFSTVFIAMYISSTLAASIKESRMSDKGRMLTPIESADDLSKQSDIAYGTLESGSTKSFFQNSRVQPYRRMWESMARNPDVFATTTAEGIERVRSSRGRYAFLLESSMNDYFNQRMPCNTMKIGPNLDTKGYGIATPVGSPLKDAINHEIMVMLETGFFGRLYQKWWYDKGECSVQKLEKEGFYTAAKVLEDMAGLFYILLAGFILSIAVFTVELLYKFRNKRAHKEKQQGEVAQKEQLFATAAALSEEAADHEVQ